MKRLIPLAFSMLCMGCAPPRPSSPPDVTGVWRLASLKTEGKEETLPPGVVMLTTFSNGHFHSKVEDIEVRGTYQIRATTPYPILDITIDQGAAAPPYIVPCVYSLDGDKLTIWSTADGQRPSDIGQSNICVQVMRRATK